MKSAATQSKKGEGRTARSVCATKDNVKSKSCRAEGRGATFKPEIERKGWRNKIRRYTKRKPVPE
jgi:hypothetical protein